MAFVMTAPVLVPAAEAAGPTALCDPNNFDRTVPFTDGCYHQGVWYSPETAEFDVLIVPPVSPYELRDIELVEESVDMWENSMKRLGAPWLAEGVHINDYTLGLEIVPVDALQDPEVIILLTTEFHAVAVGGLFGVAVLPSGGPCMDIIEAIETGAIQDVPGFHRHPGGPFGSIVTGGRANDCGATVSLSEQQCYVVNLNFPFAPGLVNDNERRRTMFDLISHEVGHCLTLGHVGDADTEETDNSDAYPEHDIMSYEGDGLKPVDGGTHCPSTLNILTLERAFGHLFGIPGASRNVAPTQAGYTHMVPSDWAEDPDCEHADADYLNPFYLAGRLPPGEDQDADVGGPTGDPVIVITSPQDDTEVPAGPVAISGTVDREGSSTGTQDADGDGVPDDEDDCPNESGPQSNGGCPLGSGGYGTRLGTDDVGDTGWTGCPQTGPTQACDAQWIAALRPGLDLKAAYVDEVDGDIRFTFEVDDASKIFAAITGDPAPLNPPGQTVAGRVLEVGLNAAFLTPGGGTTGSGVGYDVSISALRSRTQDVLDPGFDRKVQVTLVGSLSGGILSNAITPGDWGIDEDNDVIWVEFSPAANREFTGVMEAIEVRSQAILQGSGSNQVITVDTLGTIEATSFGTFPPETPAPNVGVDTLNAIGSGSAKTLYFHTHTAPVGTVDVRLDDKVATMDETPPTKEEPSIWLIQNQFGGTNARTGNAFDANWYYLGDVAMDGADITVDWTAAALGVPDGALAGMHWAVHLYVWDASGPEPGTPLKDPPGEPTASVEFQSPLSPTPTQYSATIADVQATGNRMVIAVLADFVFPGQSAAAGVVFFDSPEFPSGATIVPGTSAPLAADAGGPYSGTPSQPIAISGTASGGSGAYTCSWSGGAGAAFADASACSTTVTYAAAQTDTLTLTVGDGSTTAMDTADISIVDVVGERVELYVNGILHSATAVDTSAQDEAPWADELELSGFAGQAIEVEAKWLDSDDALLASDSITLQVAQGASGGTARILSPASGATLSEGQHTITGDVTRSGGNQVAPGVAITADASGAAGEQLQFTATVTGTAPTCAWTLEDNAASATFVGSATSCTGATVTAANAGTATVRLSASNQAGDANDAATATWTETTQPLQANIVESSLSGQAGSGLAFTATVIGGTGTPTCTWTIVPSGPVATGASCSGATYTSQSVGTHVVTLSVTRGSETDDDQADAQWTEASAFSVSVSSPSAGATVPQPFTLSGAATGTGDGEWLPLAQSSSGLPLQSAGDLDPTARTAAGLFWTPWMDSLESRLAAEKGFLGIVPNTWSGEPVVDAYFTGRIPVASRFAAPELPGGMPLVFHKDTKLEPLVYKFPAGFDLDEHRTLLTPEELDVLADNYEPTFEGDQPWNTGMGPGAPTTQTIPGDGSYGCTANYIWKDQQGKLYLGLAGHCVLPAGENAALNSGGTFDTAGVTVDVCVGDCFTGGASSGLESIFLGNYVRLGKVAYARQSVGGSSGLLGGGDVGNDFALVEIPASLYHHIDPSMPVWNGPSDMDPMNLGTQGGRISQIHGNSVGYGEVFAGKSRLGVSLERQGQPGQALGTQVWGSGNGPGGQSGYWMAIMPGEMGDSGSAVNILDPGQVPTQDDGLGAGVLTHGIGPWNILTRLSKAVGMAQEEAGICIAMVPGDADPVAFEGPDPVDGLCNGEVPPGYDVQYAANGGAWTSVDAFDPQTGAWSASVSGLPGGETTLQIRLLRDGEAVATTQRTMTVQEQTNVRVCQPDGDVDALFGADLPGNYEIVEVCGENTPGGFVGEIAVYDMVVDEALMEAQTTVTYAFFLDDDASPVEVSLNILDGVLIYDYATEDRTAGATAQYDVDADRLTLTLPAVSGVESLRVATYVGEGFLGGYFASGVTGVPITEADAAPDTGAMAIGSVRLSLTRAFGPQLGGSGERVELYLDGAFVEDATVATTPGTSDDWSIAATLTEGQHTITVEWYDGATLLDAASAIYTVQGDVNTPPTANAGPDASVAEGGSYVLQGSATDPDEGDVLTYAWTRVSGPAVTFNDAARADATVTVATVDVNQPVVLRLTVNDGKATHSDTMTLTILETTVQAPSQVTGLTMMTSTETSVTLQWDAATDNVGVTGYDLLRNGAVVASPAGTSATDPGLQPGVSYDYQVRAKDAAGNLGPTSDALSVTLEVDPTETWFMHESACNTNRHMNKVDSADFDGACYLVAATGPLGTDEGVLTPWASYPASVPSYGALLGDAYEAHVFVYYDETRAGSMTVTVSLKADGVEVARGEASRVSTQGTTFAWVEYVIAGDLLADIAQGADLHLDLYHQGAARARMGHEGSHASWLRIESTATPDFVAPAVVTGVTATASASQVQLAWSPVADADVLAYEIQHAVGAGAFQTAGTSSVTSFTDTGLSSDTTYRYRVRAVDGVGNAGPFSSIVSTTTLPPAPTAFVDITSPASGATLNGPVQVQGIAGLNPTDSNGDGFVVIAIPDSGINMYHNDFAGAFYPRNLDADPDNNVDFRAYPGTYLQGFPANVPALDLTINGNFNKDADVAAGKFAPAATLNKLFWIPGTKIIGAVDTSNQAAVNSAGDTVPIYDEDGHGTASASVAAGNLYGSCKECLIVFIEGLGGDLWATQQPWIDIVSTSGGSVGNVGVVDPLGTFGLEDVTKAAAEAGQSILYAAGNGCLAFLCVEQTYTANGMGPDWALAIGAAVEYNDGSTRSVLQSGKPVDLSSYSLRSSGAPYKLDAACPTGVSSRCEHSGTSSATPITAGHFGRILMEARSLLGDTGRVGPMRLGGTGADGYGVVAQGTPYAPSLYLADGILTRAELWHIAFHSASEMAEGASVGPHYFISNGGTGVGMGSGPADYAYAGYGIADDAMQARALRILRGELAPQDEAEADAFFAVDAAIRDTLWGDWDDDADTVPFASPPLLPTPADLGMSAARAAADVDGLFEAFYQWSQENQPGSTQIAMDTGTAGSCNGDSGASVTLRLGSASGPVLGVANLPGHDGQVCSAAWSIAVDFGALGTQDATLVAVYDDQAGNIAQDSIAVHLELDAGASDLTHAQVGFFDVPHGPVDDTLLEQDSAGLGRQRSPTSHVVKFTVPSGTRQMDLALEWPEPDFNDLDVFVMDAQGNEVSGLAMATGAMPETVELEIPAAGTYEVWISPYLVTGAGGGLQLPYELTVTLHAPSFPAADSDGDGIHDVFDNCAAANPDQNDANGNGFGDACEFVHATIAPRNAFRSDGLSIVEADVANQFVFDIDASVGFDDWRLVLRGIDGAERIVVGSTSDANVVRSANGGRSTLAVAVPAASLLTGTSAVERLVTLELVVEVAGIDHLVHYSELAAGLGAPDFIGPVAVDNPEPPTVVRLEARRMNPVGAGDLRVATMVS